MDLVLASTSPYRRALLERLRLPFLCVAPDYEEIPLPLPPVRLVEARARGKALSLKDRHPEALIIGSDQLVEFEGETLGKPGGFEAARAQLARMSGRTHRLLTAVTLLRASDSALLSATDVHRMTLRRLTDREIESYLRLDEPFDCAGSYKLESLGLALFESIRGEDDTAVQGLPLLLLLKLLREFGLNPVGGEADGLTPSRRGAETERPEGG